MEIETKVISTDIIKPSSPTPKSLQKHYLSFLDQLTPTYYSPLLYFYQSNPKFPTSKNSLHLKKSLSETLPRFYPLAGRLVKNLYVDCNDAGVPFFETEAYCSISQAITSENPPDSNIFLPYKMIAEDYYLCLAVQVTYLRCGGVAVGILISHKIADGISNAMFANAWAAVARNGHSRGLPLPKFDAATYFPPLDILGLQRPNTGMIQEEVAAKIFTFPASKIEALRERYAAGGRRPSRVETLSAFIWNQFVSSGVVKPDPDKIFIMQHAVNLRTRADPPLSEYNFGNLVWSSKARVEVGDGDVELLQKIRAAVKAVDGGYVARLKNSEKQLKELMAQASRSEVVRFILSSTCGFSAYEADFGWGRPFQFGLGGNSFKNIVTFMDAKSGGGIEALIQLRKQDMDKFEAHSKLQMFKISKL